MSWRRATQVRRVATILRKRPQRTGSRSISYLLLLTTCTWVERNGMRAAAHTGPLPILRCSDRRLLIARKLYGMRVAPLAHAPQETRRDSGLAAAAQALWC